MCQVAPKGPCQVPIKMLIKNCGAGIITGKPRMMRDVELILQVYYVK